MHLPEQLTFGLRLSIQLETKGLEGGMRVGNEGGNSVRVKFVIGERVNTERGLSFVSVMLWCWEELFVPMLSESQV